MSLRLTLDLLAPGLRTAWLSIPVSATDPDKGWARIKVQEVQKKQWDQLWQTLAQAERARAAAITDQRPPAIIAEARETERAAGVAILRACVVGHEATDFEAELPLLDQSAPEYPTILAALLAAGFSVEDATQGLALGLIATPFRSEKGVIADATIELYERVTPDRVFVINLLASIYRFHCGQVLTAGDYWRAEGVQEERIPAPFSKPLAQETSPA